MSQSPFEDGTSEPHAAAPIVSERPPDREESPRLGIIHLLGCAVCVAVYFGVPQSLALLVGNSPDPWEPSPISPRMLVGYVSMTLSCLTLGGPMLMVTRRVQGLHFPRYPGETLLVVLGMLVFVRWATVYPFAMGMVSYSVFQIGESLGMFATALMWLAATLHTRTRRWRWGFGVTFGFVAMTFIFYAGPYLVAWILGVSVATARTWYSGIRGPSIWQVPAFAAFAVVPTYLITIAVIDFRNRHVERYPWSHWAGVALALGTWLL